MDQTVLITTIIAATAAFVGAIFAEIVSHSLALYREDKLYNREVYQKLYAPILLDVYIYFEMRTGFRRGHDVNPKEERKIYEKIKEHFSNSLMFAGPKFISAYHNSQQVRIGDETGFMSELYEVELLLIFLDELHVLAKHNKIFDKSVHLQITHYRALFRIWLIAGSMLTSETLGAMFLRHKWQFNYQSLTERFYHQLRKYDGERFSFGKPSRYEDFTKFVLTKLLKDKKDRAYIEEELISLSTYELSNFDYSSYYPHRSKENETEYSVSSSDSTPTESNLADRQHTYEIEIDEHDPVKIIISRIRPFLNDTELVLLSKQVYILAAELELILGREGYVSEDCVWELTEACEWLEMQEDKDKAYKWLKNQTWSEAR